MLENYREPEELLSDEFFLSWYFKTEAAKRIAWERWMASHPEQHDLVRQAVDMLDAARIPERPVPEWRKERAEALLRQKISVKPASRSGNAAGNGLSTGAADAAPERHRVRYRWMPAAAILLLLLAGGFLLWPVLHRKPELKTPFGQISRQQLPDGTQVTMNANSQLRYFPNWMDGKDREVWLKGEAIFEVTKTARHSRFIVHTDPFDIIVTGTRFNVLNRHNKAHVQLQEGSVLIRTKDGQETKLVPGDYLESDLSGQVHKQVRADSSIAWKDQKLVFDNTPLREVAAIITDTWGVPVRLTEDSIGRRTISGILPNNNLDVLLQALEATSDFRIRRDQDTIIISGAP